MPSRNKLSSKHMLISRKKNKKKQNSSESIEQRVKDTLTGEGGVEAEAINTYGHLIHFISAHELHLMADNTFSTQTAWQRDKNAKNPKMTI